MDIRCRHAKWWPFKCLDAPERKSRTMRTDHQKLEQERHPGSVGFFHRRSVTQGTRARRMSRLIGATCAKFQMFSSTRRCLPESCDVTVKFAFSILLVANRRAAKLSRLWMVHSLAWNNMATLDNPFPEASVADPQEERAIVKLMRFLETRIQERDLLQEDVHEKQNHFRNILVELEHENTSLRYDSNEQKQIISTLENRVCKLQNHIDDLIYKLNNACDIMRSIQQELRDKDRQLKQHMLEKQKIIQKCNVKIQTEVDRVTQEMEMKLQEQHERLTNYIKKKDNKMRLVRQILTSARKDTFNNITLTPPMASSSRIETVEKANLITSKEEPSMVHIELQASRNSHKQIRQVLSCHERTIPNDTHGKVAEGSSSLSKEKPSVSFINSQTSDSPPSQICQKLSFRTRINSDDVQKKNAKELVLMTKSSMLSDSKIDISEELNPTTSVDSPSLSITPVDTTIVSETKLNTKIPVVNPRYQRVQNADRWINHRPTGIVPTGTILQPRTQSHKRTIRKLTNPKDFMTKSSRYCLLSQEQSVDGELETKLYKADVLPTCGGGAQIVFNDIECLKQISPNAAKKHNGQIKLKNN